MAQPPSGLAATAALKTRTRRGCMVGTLTGWEEASESVGGGRRGREHGAGGCDADAAGSDDGGLDGAVRLDVEDADDVADRAGLGRLAAHRQHDAGHFIGDGHGLVTLHDLRLRKIVGPQHLAGAQRDLGREADRLGGGHAVAANLGLRAALDRPRRRP